MKPEQIATVVLKVAELANIMGVQNIGDLPGAWQQRIDDNWVVALNGKDTSVFIEEDGLMAADLPPFHMAIWYNGWLAGFVHPLDGGPIAAGSAANEDAFIAAVEAVIGLLTENVP